MGKKSGSKTIFSNSKKWKPLEAGTLNTTIKMPLKKEVMLKKAHTRCSKCSSRHGPNISAGTILMPS